MNDPLLRLSAVVSRIRWRLPGRSRQWACWVALEDWLAALHWMRPRRRAALHARLAQSRSSADWLDAAAFLNPQQIPEEITGLLDFLRPRAPRTVVEIGTATGGTHLLLGAALPSVQLKLGVDLRVRNQRLLREFGPPRCRQAFLSGSSRDPRTVARVRAELRGDAIDLLFIDGDHSYAGVRADFELYAPLVRPGGWVAFHDIVPDYRTRHGRDTGRYAGDVPVFWREIRGQFAERHEFVAHPDQDGLGIGLGRIRDS